jgi:hypothetical protein
MVTPNTKRRNRMRAIARASYLNNAKEEKLLANKIAS